MKDEDFFANFKVTFLGLGLMGGSLALSLKGRCRKILAVDPDPVTREFALRKQIVDQISDDPFEMVPDADIIILSAPVNAILNIIPRLPDLHSGAPLILDLGSTKVEICQALAELPPRFEPIGGHPMCGKAVGGLPHAEAKLFQGAAFALTPLARTTERALEFAEKLVDALNAVPVWVGPNTHDRWVASTSHLPYLISTALALATPAEASHLVGPGFRSTTRLAGSPSSVMQPILETNRTHVLDAIAIFRKHMDEIEYALNHQDYSTLSKTLDQGCASRDLLTGLWKGEIIDTPQS
jgi:prephenate dehydrogenase